MAVQKFVKYFRVSTKKQGRSGLGLEAQEEYISIYLERLDSDYEIVDSFTDIESGKNSERQGLTEAIQLAKETNAVLLVAKLDRLTRSVAFIANLMEDKKLTFRVATMPNASEFELHIYAALGQQERLFISERTKAALAAAKRRGQKLGGRRANAEARHQAVREQADRMAEKVYDVIKSFRDNGKPYHEIASHLNKLNVPTAKGGKWYDSTVRRYDLRMQS